MMAPLVLPPADGRAGISGEHHGGCCHLTTSSARWSPWACWDLHVGRAGGIIIGAGWGYPSSTWCCCCWASWITSWPFITMAPHVAPCHCCIIHPTV